jgi:hypothetical protein
LTVEWLFIKVAIHRSDYSSKRHFIKFPWGGFSLNLVKSGSFIECLYASLMNESPLKNVLKKKKERNTEESGFFKLFGAEARVTKIRQA